MLKLQDLLDDTLVVGVNNKKDKDEDAWIELQKEKWVEEAFTPVSSDCLNSVKQRESEETEAMGEVYRKIKKIHDSDIEEAILGKKVAREIRVKRFIRKWIERPLLKIIARKKKKA